MKKSPLDQWIAAKIGSSPDGFTREAIERYQLARIRETFTLVKGKSIRYRSKLTGIDPDEISGFSRLAGVPFTFPEEIMENPLGFVCTSPKEIERVVSLQSSGTTNKPKRVFFTKEDQDLTVDFFDHGMRNLIDSSDRVLILLPGEAPGSVGDLLSTALIRMGARPVAYGPVYDAGDAVAAALVANATSMVGIPTQVLRMARHEKGKELQGRIKSVLLTTDYAPDSISEAVERAWDCKVFNHYGMTEMGLGGGVQCEARWCYHMREADLYFEIVNPETGERLLDGETGEIAFTTLTRRGMPLIRYRTGDLGRFLPGRCPCGSILRCMETVKGKVSGRKMLAGIEFSLSQMDEALFRLSEVLDYECELSSAEGMEKLSIDLKTAAGFSNAEKQAYRQTVLSALQAIPAVRKGLVRGILKITLNFSGSGPDVSKGAGKRQLIDRR